MASTITSILAIAGEEEVVRLFLLRDLPRSGVGDLLTSTFVPLDNTVGSVLRGSLDLERGIRHQQCEPKKALPTWDSQIE
jgi:hypothetical protein